MAEQDLKPLPFSRSRQPSNLLRPQMVGMELLIIPFRQIDSGDGDIIPELHCPVGKEMDSHFL